MPLMIGNASLNQTSWPRLLRQLKQGLVGPKRLSSIVFYGLLAETSGSNLQRRVQEYCIYDRVARLSLAEDFHSSLVKTNNSLGVRRDTDDCPFADMRRLTHDIERYLLSEDVTECPSLKILEARYVDHFYLFGW